MKPGYVIGVGLGALHLIVFILVAYSFQPNDLPWIWMVFFPIDFPFSLLTIGGLYAMQDLWGDVVWAEHWKHVIYNYWPFFVHGVIGSLWWGSIPILVGRVIAKRKLRRNA